MARRIDVCESCLVAVQDEPGGNRLGGREVEQMARELGADIADHECCARDEGEPCGCGCRVYDAGADEQGTGASEMDTVFTFMAAKLRASDNYLGFGAQWVYYDYDGGFKVARVPREHGDWLRQRLMSGLDLFGRGGFPHLAATVQDAEEIAGPYVAEGRVE